MAIRAFWGDVFDITFIPAMTLEEGPVAAQAMAPIVEMCKPHP